MTGILEPLSLKRKDEAKNASNPKRIKTTLTTLSDSNTHPGHQGLATKRKKKRILLNAFDMNGIGYTRSVINPSFDY